MDFGEVAAHGRAVMALRIVGFRVGVAFTQDSRHESRHSEHRVALAEQEAAAEP